MKESFPTMGDDGKKYVLTSWVKLSAAASRYGGPKLPPIEGLLLHYQTQQGDEAVLKPDESFRIASTGMILRRIKTKS
jgi:hypothetical protein